MTYDKRKVLIAAKLAMQTMQAERERLVGEWREKNFAVRFFSDLFGHGCPDYDGARQQTTAERVAFKAAFCVEGNIPLADYEIDAIRDFWDV